MTNIRFLSSADPLWLEVCVGFSCSLRKVKFVIKFFEKNGCVCAGDDQTRRTFNFITLGNCLIGSLEGGTKFVCGSESDSSIDFPHWLLTLKYFF